MLQEIHLRGQVQREEPAASYEHIRFVRKESSPKISAESAPVSTRRSTNMLLAIEQYAESRTNHEDDDGHIRVLCGPLAERALDATRVSAECHTGTLSQAS